MEVEIQIYLDKINKSNNSSVRETWVIKNLNKLWIFINDYKGDSFSERLFNYINTDIRRCKVCDNYTKFLSFNRGYREFCSTKCSNSDIDLNKKKIINSKLNNLEKYGVDNTSKLDYVRKKISKSKENLDYSIINLKFKENYKKKYGVDNPSKNELVKLKKKETTFKNFGVDNPFESNIIKNKIKIKNLEKYGVEHPLKSSIIRDKLRITNLEKYGYDNFRKTEISKYNTIIYNDINYIEYLGKSIYSLKCNNGHSYQIKYDNYYHRLKNNITLCTNCYPINDTTSEKERELLDFLKSIYSNKIISGYRDSLEIDIYLPDIKIGFEFNGLYWHSEKNKKKEYHINKTNYFKDREIRIIHIWEDDWIYKKNIIKSQISNLIGLSKNKIWARKCEIKLVSSKDCISFINENHIQGKDKSIIKIGLYYNNELLGVMTFDKFEGRKKMEEGGYNLSRFCNKLDYNIIGGASKLLSYFIKNYNPSRIVSYADKDWSIGQLYYTLGFTNINESKPDYKYVIGDKRLHKSNFRKSNIGISESNLNLNKIWDCGKIKFEKFINIYTYF